MTWTGMAAAPLASPVALALLATGLVCAGFSMLHPRVPKSIMWFSIAMLVIVPLTVFAATSSVANTFTNGTTADADEVNENFASAQTQAEGKIGDCAWSMLGVPNFNSSHDGGWVCLEGQFVFGTAIDSEFGITSYPPTHSLHVQCSTTYDFCYKLERCNATN